VARFVCTNNGQQLIAASPNSKGPFIDFLDPGATRFHFEYIINKLGLKKGGDPACPLKALAVDSMELHPGIQWTPKFPEVFGKDHDYDPVAWLPVLTGWTIKDKETFRPQLHAQSGSCGLPLPGGTPRRSALVGSGGWQQQAHACP
jgi:hypothetical protein